MKAKKKRGSARMLELGRVQVVLWLTREEAGKIADAARAEKRAVGPWIRKIALEAAGLCLIA